MSRKGDKVDHSSRGVGVGGFGSEDFEISRAEVRKRSTNSVSL